MSLNNRKGLTVIELVIAMSLSVVIIVILVAAMRLAYKSQEKGMAMSEETQKVRIIADRLTWLLRGTYPYIVNKPDLKKIYFVGKSDMVGFVTTSIDKHGKGPEDTAGLKWVSIYTDRKGLRFREKVFFMEDVFDEDGGKEYLLDPDVRELEFSYYDVPEDGKEGEWVSDWDPDDKEYFPAAVKLVITLERNGKTVVMPEIIASINAQNFLKK